MEKYRELLERTKQARFGQIIILLSGILQVFGGQEPMIQGFKEDGSQRTGAADV